MVLKTLCKLALILGFASRAQAQSDVRFAIVRIPSHGVTGWVYGFTPAGTVIVTAAHGWHGDARHKKIVVTVPVRRRVPRVKVTNRLLVLDLRRDVAVVLVPRRLDLTPLSLASRTAKPGDRLCLIGYPKMALVVSQLKQVATETIRWQPRFIMAKRGWTKAPENFVALITKTRATEGYSGGPILNTKNEVVGQCWGTTENRTQTAWRGVYVSVSEIRAALAKGGVISAPAYNKGNPGACLT